MDVVMTVGDVCSNLLVWLQRHVDQPHPLHVVSLHRKS